MISLVRRFLALETAGGLLLIAAAALAMALKNSPLAGWYDLLLALPMEVRVGELRLAKPLTLWVNDGLMAVFFFLIGLEIKREALTGALSSARKAALPLIAAAGGMAVPAAIYAAINWQDPVALRGWAIPSATDIAFAIGVLTLLGSRVPVTLKVLLTAIAVIDDLGAIVIIALFYADDLSPTMILWAAAGVATLAAMNVLGVRKLGAYVLVGLAVWVCVLKSGVHATLAGVITALAVPLAALPGERSPLEAAEHELRSWVTFGVLPVFAFVNAGVALGGLSFATLAHGVPLGIAAGLFFGKATGIFAACWMAIRTGVGEMPSGASWAQLFGVAVLCGIGFTMSLFIGSLAFEHQDERYATLVRLGVLAGSLLSACSGYVLLRLVGKAR